MDIILYHVNRAFEKEVGVKRVDCLGRRMSEVIFIHGHDPNDWIGLYALTAETGMPSTYEMLSPNTKRWFRVSINSPRKGHLLSIVEDIDDRKRAEEALKESEAKYRSLFENIQIPVNLSRNIFDEGGKVVDGVLLDINPAGVKALEAISPDEVMGKRHSELYSPETMAASLEVVNTMVATGKAATGEMHNDRTDKDYIMTVAPIGKDVSITAKVDITDLKRAQRALEEREEDLRNAQMVSHTGSWRLDLSLIHI